MAKWNALIAACYIISLRLFLQTPVAMVLQVELRLVFKPGLPEIKWPSAMTSGGLFHNDIVNITVIVLIYFLLLCNMQIISVGEH